MKEYNPEIFYSNYIIWERKSDFRMPNIFKEKKNISENMSSIKIGCTQYTEISYYLEDI